MKGKGQNGPLGQLETSLGVRDLGALGHRIHLGDDGIGIEAERCELLAKLFRRSRKDALVDRIVQLAELVLRGAPTDR